MAADPGRMFAPLVLVVAVLLAAGSGWWYRRAIPRGVAVVAGPWLVLPPLLLAAASLGRSYFADRYLLFCLPAMALLLGTCCAAVPLPLRMALALTLTGPFALAHQGIRRERSCRRAKSGSCALFVVLVPHRSVGYARSRLPACAGPGEQAGCAPGA